jgi:hypothetical protein
MPARSALIARKQLNPHEEARAVQAMLADGLTEDGAAQALGWSKARVTARVKLLELPERAQQLVGAGTIALSSVDQLRAIAKVSPPLLEALIEYLCDGNEWAAERLAREPGWVLDAALRETDTKVFVAHLTVIDDYDIAQLKLGKKATEQYAKASELHKALDRYSYGGPRVRFSDEEVDQARAAGVTIEFEHGAPLIVDRSLYRELVKQAIARTVSELEAAVAEQETERQASRNTTRSEPTDPLAEAERDERRQLRVCGEQAHGVNLDVGTSLLTGLSAVDPADMTVARFFAYGLLGSDYDESPYTQTGEQVTRLAMCGIRLVIDEFRSDVTKTLKNGQRGHLRIDYGDPHKPDEAVKWLWKFVDGAKTAGELYGRALVVICAEQYASRLVVPQSQRSHPTRWSSHKDHAAKALKKLAGPHLPASLKELEKAIARAYREHDTTVERAQAQAQADRSAGADTAHDAEDQIDADQGADYGADPGELNVDDELEAEAA